jgi:hypothetical protein
MVRTRKITLPSWHSSAQLAHLRVSLSEIEYLRSTVIWKSEKPDGKKKINAKGTAKPKT